MLGRFVQSGWQPLPMDFRPQPLNDTLVLSARSPNTYKIFTSQTVPVSRDHVRHQALPLEKQWGLLGLGLCPTSTEPAPWPPQRRQGLSLLGCLAACSAKGSCSLVSFSQRRRECILRADTKTCAHDDLHWHVSFATFVSPSDAEEAVPLTRMEVGGAHVRQGWSPEEAMHVFAFVSPGFLGMFNAFFRSLEQANDHAVLFLHNQSVEDYVPLNSNRTSWGTPTDQRGRDYHKTSLMVRAVWESFRAGARQALLSDIDIQLFPGWAELVRGCTAAAPFCLGQQPGLWPERARPFNSGILAMRSDMATLELVLDLLAQYEPQLYWEDPGKEPKFYHLEQDVISQYLFERGPRLWGVFNPQLVKHGDYVWDAYVPFLKLKVVHVCASSTTHRKKLNSMQSIRRAYYGMSGICMSEAQSGPQHPCCLLFGYQRSVFTPEVPDWPPYMVGSHFGPPPENRTMLWAGQRAFWKKKMGLRQSEACRLHCMELRGELMHQWNEDESNSLAAFTSELPMPISNH